MSVATCYLCRAGTNSAVVCRSCRTVVARAERDAGEPDRVLADPELAVSALIEADRPADPDRIVAYLRRRAGWRRGRETLASMDAKPGQLAYVRSLAQQAGVEDPTPEVGSALDASRQIARLRAVLRRAQRATATAA
jgi:hypothetical protein